MGFAITEDMIKNPDTYIDGPLTVISERHQVAYEAIIAAHERYYNELAEREKEEQSGYTQDVVADYDLIAAQRQELAVMRRERDLLRHENTTLKAQLQALSRELSEAKQN